MRSSEYTPEQRKAILKFREALIYQHKLFVTQVEDEHVSSTGSTIFVKGRIGRLSLPHEDHWVWNQSKAQITVEESKDFEVVLKKLNPRRKNSQQKTKHPSYKLWVVVIKDKHGNRDSDMNFIWCEKGCSLEFKPQLVPISSVHDLAFLTDFMEPHVAQDGYLNREMSGLDVDALLGSVYGDDLGKFTIDKAAIEKEENKDKQTTPTQTSQSSPNNSSGKKRGRSGSPAGESPERKRRESPKEEKKTSSPSKSRRRPGRSEWSRREKSPPELSPESQAEQDARTVFVSGLPTKVAMKDLFEFFEQGGKVKDVSLISDRNSRRSKGIGYIQYENKSSIPSALALSGSQFQGHAITIQATMAEKNRIVAPARPAAQSAAKIVVSNVDSRLVDDDLAYFFEQIGEIVNVVFRDEIPSNSKEVVPRTAIVTFRKTDDAKKALEQCNNFKLVDFHIKVESYSNDMYFPSFTGGEGELDGGDGNGIRLDARSRLALMNRLSQRPGRVVTPATTPISAISTPIAAPFGQPLTPALLHQPSYSPAPVAPVIVPTCCLILKNMFDLDEARNEPELFTEVEEAVTEECSKFGKILHILVDRNSPGNVFIKLDSIKAAEQTYALLNKRWFAGKMVTVEYLPEAVYRTKFPGN